MSCLTGESVTIHLDQVRCLAQSFQDRADQILAEVGVKTLTEDQLMSIRDGDGGAGHHNLFFSYSLMYQLFSIQVQTSQCSMLNWLSF